MNKNIKNILREKIIRTGLKKNELFLKILKSIQQNNNINNSYKNYISFALKKLNQKNNNICKKNNVCFYTGKRGGVLNMFGLSRYTIKSMVLQNKMHNVKKNNW